MFLAYVIFFNLKTHNHKKEFIIKYPLGKNYIFTSSVWTVLYQERAKLPKQIEFLSIYIHSHIGKQGSPIPEVRSKRSTEFLEEERVSENRKKYFTTKDRRVEIT